MLRITTHSTADSLTFQLEGRLVGPWVRELRDCWRRTPRDGKRAIHIDLRAVTCVDAAGEKLLTHLYRQGVDQLAMDCQMKALVEEIENTCANLIGTKGRIMTRELANQRPSFDDFVADLTEAAYPIALRHKGGERWLDLELDLWRAMAQTVKKWEQHAYLPLS